MADFHKYRVWQKAHELTLDAYRTTKSYPPDERFGLTAQMRRAVASIPTNIAEGLGKIGDNERARFLNIAMGSASEFQYQILLSRDLGYLDANAHDKLHGLVVEVRKMLGSLRSKLLAVSC